MGEESEAKAGGSELAVQAAPGPLALRNAKGQFVKGTSGGPGRPQGRSQSDAIRVIKALQLVCTDAELQLACKAVLKRAKDGDVAAFREIMNRLVGLPPQALDVYSRSEAHDSLLHYLEIYHVGPGRQLPEDESE